MQTKRWVRPLLAFLITFGVLAMAGAVVRVVVLYQRMMSNGVMPDDPAAANEVTREMMRMDQMYTPVFLLVAFLVSGAFAAVFALWRPKAKVDLPPPLPAER